MQTTETALLILLLVAFVIYRQFRTRPANKPLVLIIGGALFVGGIASGGVVDPLNPTLSVALFGVEALVAVALGAWRAATVRMWLDASGMAWAKGTSWTLVAWLASIAVRVGLYLAGQALGLPPSTGGVLVFVGLTIGVQGYLVASRGRTLARANGRSDTVTS